jgi:cytochrome c556
MKTLFAAGLALALAGGYTLGAFAQQKPETHVRQRQAVMTLQGKYFYPLVPMAQGKIAYDPDLVARNAAYLDVLNRMPWDNFVDASAGVQNTRALPEIYKNSAKFKASADNLQAAIGKLLVASKSANEAGAKAAIGEVNKACNACHDSFRARQ